MVGQTRTVMDKSFHIVTASKTKIYPNLFKDSFSYRTVNNLTEDITMCYCCTNELPINRFVRQAQQQRARLHVSTYNLLSVIHTNLL